MKLWNKKRVWKLLSAFTLALLALAGGGVYFLSSPDFEQFGADYIVGWIEQRTGAAVTLEAFDADFRRQRFNLEGLVLRGEEDPSDAPLMSIERVEIGLSWTGLLRRSLNLSSLSIERPQIFMTIDAGEGTNVPVPESNSSGGSSAFGLSIDDFVVANGSLTVDEQRVDVDFSLTGLEGEFGYEGTTGVLSGRIEFSGAVEREGRPLIPYALSADFDYTQGTVLVERAELESGTSSLNFQGRIDQILRTPEGQLGYTGSVELGFLNYFFVEEDLEGRMDISGDLEFSAEHFEAGGRVRSDGLTVEGWAAESLVSDFEYSFPESLLVATDLQVDVLGGGVVGEARVLSLPGPDRRVELDIAYQGIDTSALRRIYPWEGPYVVTSRAGGTLTGWFEGKFNSFDFQGSASFDPVSGTASSDTVVLPVSGSTLYRGIPGSVEVSGLVAQLGSTAVEADGLIDRDASSLDFSVESEDFRDLGFLYGGANGSGRIDGVVEGPISAPDLSGDFTVVDYNYEDWAIDRIEGRAVLTSSEVKLSGVRVIENDSEIRLNGVFDRNLGEPDLTLDIRRLTGRDLRRLVDRPVDGVVTGEIYVESIDPLRFDGLLKSTEFAYQGHSLGGIEAGVTFDPESIRISDLTLIGDGASLTGNLTYGREAAALNGRIAFSGHRLEEFGWLGVPAGITGVVRSASFRVDGSVDAPLIEGEAVFEDFQFREQRFPEAALSVEVAGQGIFVRIQAGPELSLSAEIDTSRDGYPFDGTARFLNYSADQLAGLENGSLTVTGDASFQGKLLDPAAFEGSGRVTDLTARFQKRDLRVSRPFVFDFDPDQVEVSSVELTGEATALVLEGTVAVSEQAPLDLSVRGSIDLSLVASGYEGVETGGTIIVDGQVLGDLANPELGGIATLENVSIGHEDLFLSLSSLSGDLFFDGNRVNLNDLRGSAGGGDVTLRGTVGVEGTGPGEMDIRIDAANVRVRTTEGLRTVVDGALALRGTPETPSLEGNLEVVDLSFDENFDAFLALFGDNLGGVDQQGPLDHLALALHVEGDRNIQIANDLVSIDARLDLDFAGTLGDPAMTGHIESTDGNLTFQGTRYRITRGAVDFVDPLGIEPLIDVQAETELRDYRIVLAITGRGDDIRLDMRSDPPLPQLEIISLIAGGRTRGELAEDRPDASLVPTSEQLFTGGAATILADLLQERVGSRLGVLGRVRIDPFLVGAENDPVARVTISEQITRDLAITYSQDLSSTRQQIILIEYFLNNDTSFIASRDETGALGVDIRLRQRFR